ncbi:MAG TPA: gamma-glutamyl-gamma-aminobutyrate hydrolase family protein [Ilumatobacteraceae bacterium]|nr:gamma-glutamyl-gamma-aminobutyrate hydrolase family protein [Ilumatobacteraceae bacterium]
MRALLIANAGDADGGFVAERFRQRGYSFTECHRENLADWPDLAGHELVLTLGSEWSVYWPHVAESVAAEADLIREAQAAAVPIYGICYGNQIMAHALGGTVERARQPEIGWHQVVSDLPEVIAEGPWMQWHYDVVTVPANSTELARSAIGPQAWRLGRSFCTQFHPEATETMIRRWASSDGGSTELLKYGMKPDQLIEESRRNVADSQPAAEHLVDWFLDHVVGVDPYSSSSSRN